MTTRKPFVFFVICMSSLALITFTWLKKDARETTNISQSSTESMDTSQSELNKKTIRKNPYQTPDSLTNQIEDEPTTNQELENSDSPREANESNSMDDSPSNWAEKLSQEKMVFQLIISGAYDSYSVSSLKVLAEEGDPIALEALIGHVSLDELKRLAKISVTRGNPMAYGLMSDIVLSKENDKVLSMAYFLASLIHGSELMHSFRDDYKKRYHLTEEEYQTALLMAQDI